MGTALRFSVLLCVVLVLVYDINAFWHHQESNDTESHHDRAKRDEEVANHTEVERDKRESNETILLRETRNGEFQNFTDVQLARSVRDTYQDDRNETDARLNREKRGSNETALFEEI